MYGRLHVGLSIKFNWVRTQASVMVTARADSFSSLCPHWQRVKWTRICKQCVNIDIKCIRHRILHAVVLSRIPCLYQLHGLSSSFTLDTVVDCNRIACWSAAGSLSCEIFHSYYFKINFEPQLFNTEQVRERGREKERNRTYYFCRWRSFNGNESAIASTQWSRGGYCFHNYIILC